MLYSNFVSDCNVQGATRARNLAASVCSLVSDVFIELWRPTVVGIGSN